MGISISGGASGVTIETDPTALKLTGGTLSGTLFAPEIRNLLNETLIIDSYNDTGAGTHYEHTFTPFDGKFNLAVNGGGLTFPNGTTQVTAGLPLTGGTLSGKVNTLTPTSTDAGINIGSIDSTSILTNSTAGDLWIGRYQLTYKNGQGNIVYGAGTNIANQFNAPQIISGTNTAPALRVTQNGSGPALVVEDSTNPDTSSFVIDTNGAVAIGFADSYSNPGKFSVNGSSYLSGNVYVGSNNVYCQSSVVTYLVLTASPSVYLSDIQIPVTATGTYDKELQLRINNVNYRIPCRQV